MTDLPVNAEQNRPAPRRRSVLSRILWAVVFVLALTVGLLLTVLAVGTLVPGLGALSTLAALLVATLAPWFAIVAAAVLVVGLIGMRRGFRRSGLTTAALGGASLVANVVAITLLLVATTQAGGSVDLARATFGLQPMDGATPDSRVVYDTTPDGEELMLSVYEPASTTETPTTIMYVHGGGWTLGTADQLSSEFRQLADDGYLVVTVDYELASPTKHTWDRTPGQIDCAAAWIGENIDDLGGSLDKLAFWGDSAGGNLAINAAYAARAGTAVSECGAVPAPQVVIGDFPAVDVAAVYDGGFDLAGLSAHVFTTNYLGGTPTEYPERYAAVSSDAFLSADAPDTLLIVPGRDQLVPPSPTSAWAERAEAAGASVDLVTIPLTMHVYTQQAYNSIGSQIHLSIAEQYLQTRFG